MSVIDTFSNIVNDITNNEPNYIVERQADGVNEYNKVIESSYGGDQVMKISENDLQPVDYNAGGQSIMNEHAIITIGKGGNHYKDNTSGKLWFDDTIAPTANNIIVKWNENNPFAPYKIEDFLYAKYYGLIPNNRLITLRRFIKPVYDNLQTTIEDTTQSYLSKNKDASIALKKLNYPIATAVTWFGNETGNNLKDFLDFSVGLKWGDETADVKERSHGAVGYEGNNSLLKKLFTGLAHASGDASVGVLGTSARRYGSNIYDPYKDGPLQNVTFGPINVIDSTKKRERGLEFTQSFEVTFTYNLRSYDSNNPKVVILDILSNFLTLTYNFAEFWGGSYRYQPGDSTFAPIPGGFGFVKALHEGKIDTIMASANKMLDNVTSQASGILKSLQSSFGKVTSGNWKGALNDVLGGLQKSGLMAGFLEKLGVGDITGIMSYPPLLTGEPVGEWHLTVGNPFNPTMMIGNLICKNMEVSFNEEMNFEGMPTEVSFKISLEHGRPRDAGDIQSMFNRGNGRIYHYMDKEINESSSTRHSNIDEGTKAAGELYFDTKQGKMLRRKPT